MDIYIFKGEQKYSPIQLDFVQKDSLYFFSHPFEFSNSIPSKAQILEDSFNNKIHYIYGRSELDRLVKDKVIVKIYR